MKQLLSILILAFLTLQASATILRVNNTSGSSAPYSNLSDAHAIAQDGDTIYVEGSPFSYGNLDVMKRLVFIGPGYFVGENPCRPVSQAAIVGIFSLLPSVSNDVTSGAFGTEIRGLSFTGVSSTEIRIWVSNVVVAQCVLSNVSFRDNNVTSTQVMQNFFQGFSAVTTISNSPGLIQLTFTNNIVTRDFRLPDNSSGAVNHNVFEEEVRMVAFTGEIRSNIASTQVVADIEVTVSGSLTHNSAGAGQFGSSNSNNTVLPGQLFVDPAGNSTDGQYQLKPTATQVIGNAHDGTDRGAFGGNLPYVLSGVPNIPFIKALETNAPNSPSIPLRIFIQAQSGN